MVYAFLVKPGRFSTVLAVALIFSGGVGNLYDRIAYGGSVVDFISIGIGPVRTGIFNIADIAITVGVLILLTVAFRRQQKGR